ncbi:MAG: septation protein A [Chromatiaceae bacterium]
MKLLIDFFPILLFFIAYKLAGIYVATGVAIAAAALQVGWAWWRHRKVEKMHLATLALLAVFGGMTLALHDPIFVMWKPTLVNWLFAAVFLGNHFIGGKTVIERMMSHAIELPAAIWPRLNLLWVIFFFLSGAANLYVVYDYSGFYVAQQALMAAAGLTDINLATCADQFQFQGSLLAQCQDAQAREDTWVNFKLFGMLGMTVAFVIAQGIYLARHIRQPAEVPEA